MFMLHEFQEGLLDYREQYPMDRRVTLGAAKALNIRHPIYPRTGVPVVMTIDAIVTRQTCDGITVEAWDAKPQSQLSDRRTLEKLKLHQAYCSHFGLPHHIYTEASVPRVVIQNIVWLRGALAKTHESAELQSHLVFMTERFYQAVSSVHKKRPPTHDFCSSHDAMHGYEAGTSIRLLKILAWQHRILLDLTQRNPMRSPLPLLGLGRPQSLLKLSA
jgi:hypothetical protein